MRSKLPEIFVTGIVNSRNIHEVCPWDSRYRCETGLRYHMDPGHRVADTFELLLYIPSEIHINIEYYIPR